MNTEEFIYIHFVGEDNFNRAVFLGSNKRYYKTTIPVRGTGFSSMTIEEQYTLAQDLHTCNGKFHGEPSTPCRLERFVFHLLLPLFKE